MKHRIDQEVPTPDCALVSIRVQFILVLDLVTDHLVQFPAFELDLLFVELVLDHVRAAFVRLDLLFVFIFGVLLRDALTIVIPTVLVRLAGLLIVDDGSVSSGWSVCISDIVLHAAVILINFDLIATLPKLLSVGICLTLPSRRINPNAITTFKTLIRFILVLHLGNIIILIIIKLEERLPCCVLHFI